MPTEHFSVPDRYPHEWLNFFNGECYGDGPAMDIDEFIEKHQKAIQRYSFSICGRRELAEEIAQETFIRVTAHYALLSIQPEGQRLAWAFTAAKNLAFDHLRAKRREERFVEQAELQAGPGDPSEPREEMRDLVAKLSPTMQEALLLKFELGMNSREISAKLKVPEGTVRRRIQLGLTKLKKNQIKEE